MKKFDFEQFKRGETAIHFSTEKQAKSFLEFIDRLGVTWGTGERASYAFTSYGSKEFPRWSKGICYRMNNGGLCYGYLKLYNAFSSTILEYDDLYFEETQETHRLDCSQSINLLREDLRMTKNCALSCSECPLGLNNNNHKITCDVLKANYPEEVVNIIQKWSDEHPMKTYKEDFFEKFPKALRSKFGYPMAKANSIYGEVFSVNDFRGQWNTPFVD